MKTLVVNADDFGFTRDVNDGIVEAHQKGILTATTLMANGSAFVDAVTRAAACPGLDIGCHLVLVGGESVRHRGQALPSTPRDLVAMVLRRRLDVAAELRAQIEKILAAGIRPLHLDTHKHTHLFPPVLDAVARLSEEYGIRWVRRPFDLPLTAGAASWTKRAVSRGVGYLRRRFHAKLARHGCRTTDHFAGFQLTGHLNGEELHRLLEVLPEGVTEFMCHPGHCTEELRSMPTRLKESRQRELEALTDPAIRRRLDALGVRLAGYRDLSTFQ